MAPSEIPETPAPPETPETPASPTAALHQPLLLWSLPFTFLYFTLPIISKGFGASAFEIGGLFTVFTVTTLILRPVVGWALDRYGRKPFFVAALLVYALAMVCYALADSLNWLFAARLLQGVGSAFLWSAVNTLVADLTPPGERGHAMGRIAQTTARGGMIGIFAAFVPMMIFPEDVGWKIAFAAFAAATLYGAYLAWRGVPTVKREPRPRPSGKPLVSKTLLRLLVMVFITGIPEAMLAPIYLIYLQDKFTTDMMSIAWAFFPGGLVAVFFAARLGALSDRFGRAPMMALGLAGAGLVSLVMPMVPSLALLTVVYVLSSVLWAVSEPAETALVADLTGGDRLGMGYGLYDFVENLGFAVGPLLGGLLYDTVSRSAPFYLNGIILILAAGWVLVFLRGAALPAPRAETAD